MSDGMERLTKKIEDNYYCNKEDDVCDEKCPDGKADDCCCDCPIRQEMNNKLGTYEDTNRTPEQIKDFDKLYLEKCEEVNRQHKEIQILSREVLRLKDHILELEEKRIPKKPIDISDSQHSEKIGTCPSCGQRNSIYKKFCIECGQAIDWSVEE